MRKFFPIVLASAIAMTALTPVLADDVGVHVGPVGAGVNVGDHDRDSMREHRSVVVRHPTNCRMIVSKTYRNGTEVTRRIRKCD